MELSEALGQLKDSLAKYSSGRILHVSEAAEILKVKEKYLTDFARQGKVKAFRIGEHWFMEEKWLHDFRGIIRDLVDKEIAQFRSSVNHHHGWSRQVAPRRMPQFNFQPFFFLTLQYAGAAFALAYICIGFSFLCLPLVQVAVNRVTIADQFITATFAVYNSPLVLAKSVSAGEVINDEKITQAFYRLVGKNPPGQVAGAYEAEIK